MRVYVIFYGDASDDSSVDEIKGFKLTQKAADKYTTRMNKTVEGDYAYYSEAADKIDED